MSFDEVSSSYVPTLFGVSANSTQRNATLFIFRVVFVVIFLLTRRRRLAALWYTTTRRVNSDIFKMEPNPRRNDGGASSEPPRLRVSPCAYIIIVVVVVMAVVSSVICQASCSAIPMWEFLSRSEKTNHLFNMFAKQAAEYCKSSSMPDCNKVLLVYGLTNLAKMDDTQLDQMDPYQRGANDKIWESMMKDNYRETWWWSSSSSRPQSLVQQQQHERDYYADALEPSTDENYLGSASNNVEENVAPIDGNADADVNGDGDDSDGPYMTGPMIVRVRIDGSPIASAADRTRTNLPKDEDMEEHLAMRSKAVPSVSQIRQLFSATSFDPSLALSAAPAHAHPTDYAGSFRVESQFRSLYDRLK